MSIYRKQQSSRLGRSIVTAITSGTVTQATTPISANVHQVRVVSTLPIWASVADTTADITANSSAAFLPANRQEYLTCTSGQKFCFHSTSTSSGYCTVSEMS